MSDDQSTAKQRVQESKEWRTANEVRIPPLWEIATSRSLGSFYAPKSAAAIYAELLPVYKLGTTAVRGDGDHE